MEMICECEAMSALLIMKRTSRPTDNLGKKKISLLSGSHQKVSPRFQKKDFYL